jgi:hypothetical protein
LGMGTGSPSSLFGFKTMLEFRFFGLVLFLAVCHIMIRCRNEKNSN